MNRPPVPSEKQPVAIVAMGAVLPGAPDTASFSRMVMAGTDAATEVPSGRWCMPAVAARGDGSVRPDGVLTTRGYFLPDDGIGADGSDPLTRLVLEAGERTFREAVTGPVDLTRAGLIMGSILLPTTSEAALARGLRARLRATAFALLLTALGELAQ